MLSVDRKAISCMVFGLVGMFLRGAVMQEPISIDYLKNHPELIETCAQWSFQSWGKYVPERTLRDFIESRKQYALHDAQVPLTVIAFVDDTPAGMCSLTKTRDVLPDCTPWLATLYVEPEYRGQGIAALLEEKICSIAKQLGYEKIYCFTSDSMLVPWYQGQGWSKLHMGWIHNHEVTVLTKALC